MSDLRDYALKNNNDIKLKLWENELWLTLFSISFSYCQPKNKLTNYIKFIKTLALVIPHKKYKKAFNLLINEIEPITLDIVSDRITFSKYLYKIMVPIQQYFNVSFMFQCYDDIQNHFEKGYGLMTDYWGPCLWKLLHSISFGFNENCKSNYYVFLMILGRIIICTKCRKSYNYFIQNDVMINESIFINKINFSKWIYKLHNRVNQKLNKNVKIKYNDVVLLYI